MRKGKQGGRWNQLLFGCVEESWFSPQNGDLSAQGEKKSMQKESVPFNFHWNLKYVAFLLFFSF